MIFRVNPILAGLLTVGAIGVNHAATFSTITRTAPETRGESRTVIIDGNTTLTERDGNADIVIAQGAPDGQKREVRIVTRGAGAELSSLRELNTKPGDVPDIDMIVSSAMSEAFSAAGFMTNAKQVKNAPYSAEVISEKTQTLPDGNQISSKTSSLSYRDSAGRTRVWAEWREWLARRAAAGKLAPKGFPASKRFKPK